MKRRLLIIAVFLLAGAVVNVAVAWGIAVLVTEFQSEVRAQLVRYPAGGGWWHRVIDNRGFGSRLRELRGRVRRQVEDEVPTTIDVTDWAQPYRGRLKRPPKNPYPSRAVTVDRLEWSLLGYYGSEQDTWVVSEQARGWPCLSMSGALRATTVSERRPSQCWSLTIGMTALPLRPIWPGFAVNTIFYAVVLWMLCYSALALRRFIRVRRGLCPTCAYPMGESSVCSECGRELPNRPGVVA